MDPAPPSLGVAECQEAGRCLWALLFGGLQAGSGIEAGGGPGGLLGIGAGRDRLRKATQAEGLRGAARRLIPAYRLGTRPH